MAKYFVGMDPGGKKAFGWCVASAESLETIDIVAAGTCDSVKHALEAIVESCPLQPLAVGIDAPLFWSFSGDRVADRRIRIAVCAKGGSSGTVNHVNSMRGACLVQGALAVVLLDRQWPDIAITEAHPKALKAIYPGAKSFAANIALRSEHGIDAALGAFSAAALYYQVNGWIDWAAIEEAPHFPFARQVSYWFPDVRSKRP